MRHNSHKLEYCMESFMAEALRPILLPALNIKFNPILHLSYVLI